MSTQNTKHFQLILWQWFLAGGPQSRQEIPCLKPILNVLYFHSTTFQELEIGTESTYFIFNHNTISANGPQWKWVYRFAELTAHFQNNAIPFTSHSNRIGKAVILPNYLVSFYFWSLLTAKNQQSQHFKQIFTQLEIKFLG